MSRCFPFPPPGYERKLRVDDGNLLAKEKDNDKKRKRDKERKEKDKDRSKEKHRERNKDKKEKHKHKDKDKNKNKDKDQSRDEKRFRGEGSVEKASLPSQALGGRNGYVDGATGNQLINSGNASNFHKRDEISDGAVPRFDHKVNGHRDNGQKRFPTVASVCNLNGLDQRRVGAVKPVDRTIDKMKKENEKEKEKDHRSDQKGENKEEKQKNKDGKRFEGQAEIKDSKYVQALVKRIRDEKHDAIGSQVNASSQERVEPVEKLANGIAPTYSLHAKKISKFASSVENGERGNNGSKTTEVALVHNSKGLEQRGCKVAGPSDMGKNVSIEEARRNVYGGIPEKNLPKDKEDNFKQGGDNIIKLSRLGESCKDSNTVNSRQSTLKASNNGSSKRKVPEANGFIHGNETRPERLPRTVFSSPSAEKSSIVAQKSLIGSIKPQASTPKANGMMVRESPTSSAKPLSTSDVKTINRMIFAQESTIKPPQSVANGKIIDGNGLDSKKLVSISTKPKKHKEKSSKPPPPHPDIKYLSTILSIPKIDELSGFDDQDWLFENNNNRPSTESKVGTSEGDLQVWAKAVHIEAVDLYALPYVIPY